MVVIVTKSMLFSLAPDPEALPPAHIARVVELILAIGSYRFPDKSQKSVASPVVAM